MSLAQDVTPHPDGHNSSEDVAELPFDQSLIYVVIAVVAAGMATGGAYAKFRDSYPVMEYAIVATIAITAFIHLFVGLEGDLLLILNGLGYIALASVRFLPQLQQKMPLNILNGATIIYTIITIIGYFVVHGGVETVGLITKAIELALIALIFVNIRQSQANPA